MDNEKRERLEKQLEELRATNLHFIPTLQRRLELVSMVEKEYNDQKEVYEKVLDGKALNYKEFFEWFFRVKHGSNWKKLKLNPEVWIDDIEEAVSWEKNERKKRPPQLPNEPKPAPQAFGSELVEIVRKALNSYKLEEDGLLDTNGDYIGAKDKGKPLFDALKGQGLIKTKHSPTKQTKDFSELLKKEFAFYVSYKTIGKEPRTGEQQTDFEEFSRIIGEILEE